MKRLRWKVSFWIFWLWIEVMPNCDTKSALLEAILNILIARNNTLIAKATGKEMMI